MVEDGCLRGGIQEVYALHVDDLVPEGEVRVIEGPIMAGSNWLEITITGKGGHASRPHCVSDVISTIA